MMWGSKRKKPPPSSSSHSSSSLSSRPSLISHVFPVSWLSKFKQKNGNSELNPGKVEPKGRRNSPSLGSPRWESKGEGKFYGVDDDEDDAFWRLSFGDEDSASGKKTRGVLRSVWYDSDEEFQAKQSSCGSYQRSERKVEGREGSQKLKGIQAARKVWTAENDARELYRHTSSLNPRNSSLKTIEEECLEMEREELSEEKLASDWQKLKEMKMQEVKSKGEKHRKSLYISRDLQRRRTKRGSKVRVCSPRTASRVETQPEDLEELLACYLTLNSDEYHDIIIKVFRQVWLDVNRACLRTQQKNEQCCSD